MTQPVNATFRSTSWEESPLGEDAEPKLTRASCRQVYKGDIVGESVLEYLMVYRAGGDATFVGTERIRGSVQGREGTFALVHEGVFEGGVARMTLTVVAGAGTGDLAGMRGSGRFESAHAESYDVTLDCTFGG